MTSYKKSASEQIKSDSIVAPPLSGESGSKGSSAAVRAAAFFAAVVILVITFGFVLSIPSIQSVACAFGPAFCRSVALFLVGIDYLRLYVFSTVLPWSSLFATAAGVVRFCMRICVTRFRLMSVLVAFIVVSAGLNIFGNATCTAAYAYFPDGNDVVTWCHGRTPCDFTEEHGEGKTVTFDTVCLIRRHFSQTLFGSALILLFCGGLAEVFAYGLGIARQVVRRGVDLATYSMIVLRFVKRSNPQANAASWVLTKHHSALSASERVHLASQGGVYSWLYRLLPYDVPEGEFKLLFHQTSKETVLTLSAFLNDRSTYVDVVNGPWSEVDPSALAEGTTLISRYTGVKSSGFGYFFDGKTRNLDELRSVCVPVPSVQVPMLCKRLNLDATKVDSIDYGKSARVFIIAFNDGNFKVLHNDDTATQHYSSTESLGHVANSAFEPHARRFTGPLADVAKKNGRDSFRPIKGDAELNLVGKSRWPVPTVLAENALSASIYIWIKGVNVNSINTLAGREAAVRAASNIVCNGVPMPLFVSWRRLISWLAGPFWNIEFREVPEPGGGVAPREGELLDSRSFDEQHCISDHPVHTYDGVLCGRILVYLTPVSSSVVSPTKSYASAVKATAEGYVRGISSCFSLISDPITDSGAAYAAGEGTVITQFSSDELARMLSASAATPEQAIAVKMSIAVPQVLAPYNPLHDKKLLITSMVHPDRNEWLHRVHRGRDGDGVWRTICIGSGADYEAFDMLDKEVERLSVLVHKRVDFADEKEWGLLCHWWQRAYDDRMCLAASHGNVPSVESIAHAEGKIVGNEDRWTQTRRWFDHIESFRDRVSDDVFISLFGSVCTLILENGSTDLQWSLISAHVAECVREHEPKPAFVASIPSVFCPALHLPVPSRPSSPVAAAAPAPAPSLPFEDELERMRGLIAAQNARINELASGEGGASRRPSFASSAPPPAPSVSAGSNADEYKLLVASLTAQSGRLAEMLAKSSVEGAPRVRKPRGKAEGLVNNASVVMEPSVSRRYRAEFVKNGSTDTSELQAHVTFVDGNTVVLPPDSPHVLAAMEELHDPRFISRTFHIIRDHYMQSADGDWLKLGAPVRRSDGMFYCTLAKVVPGIKKQKFVSAVPGAQVTVTRANGSFTSGKIIGVKKITIQADTGTYALNCIQHDATTENSDCGTVLSAGVGKMFGVHCGFLAGVSNLAMAPEGF